MVRARSLDISAVVKGFGVSVVVMVRLWMWIVYTSVFGIPRADVDAVDS